MDYSKVMFHIPEFEDWKNEILIAGLGEIGFESFIEIENGVEAFIPENNFDERLLKQLITDQFEEYCLTWTIEKIKSQNWNEVWEKNYFEPLVIGDTCLIRAPFHTKYPSCQYEIIIEPNMAFGTGNHDTTSMMIEVILEEEIDGKTVLDMGCGTGILSIMASMLGAKNITAIDIDEWSFNGTIENAKINNIQNIKPKLGDASLLVDQKFDVILANIQRNVLIADMEKYNKVLKEGGKLIMSGFYRDDMRAIKDKAESLGLIDYGFKEKNNWVAYSFEKT